MKAIKDILGRLVDMRAATLYILIFAAAIGIATFIENDFGTSAAQKVVYKTKWFELLLVLFSIAILTNISRYKMIANKRWGLMMFHISMVIIILGAGITRYFSYEGIMHIRENDTSNSILSADTYLNFDIRKNGKQYSFSESVLFASLGRNHFKESYMVGGELLDVELKEFIPNPSQQIIDDPDGVPIIKVVMAGANGREEYYIQEGTTQTIQGLPFNFSNDEMSSFVNISFENQELKIKYDQVLSQMIMATREQDTLMPGDYHPLFLRSMYSDGEYGFVFGDFNPKGKVSLISENNKLKRESKAALVMDLTAKNRTEEVVIVGQQGVTGKPRGARFDDMQVAISYGSKRIELPFYLRLREFIMERYPGTNSAASYASEVTLVDESKNVNRDSRIYMNHILDYGGYRFFQSSFDKDEKGTYLSVNHDFWGTWVSYIGYILLTIGMILSMFSKKSRFYWLSQRIKTLREKSAIQLSVILLMFLSVGAFAQMESAPVSHVISQEHAEKFSKIVVQDHKGRMKPMHTLTRELMRKISRKESRFGMTADQIILGMLASPEEWYHVPMIKLGKHSSIKQKLGIDSDFASYSDFFEQGGGYKFRDEIRRAYSLQPIDRGVFEKELMKIDERINIASMVYSGRIFKIIPLANDEYNTWVSSQPLNHEGKAIRSEVAEKFFAAYPAGLEEASQTGDYALVDLAIEELSNYQKKTGSEVYPGKAKIAAETLLNKMNVFNRLALVYVLLGLTFLFLLFLTVFKPNINLGLAYKVLFGLVILAFGFHTLGLGLRWYVSGRAPWSNGYESMIYIAWTTTLAGLIFTRKSLGGLAATMVLAATVLLVAMLSYLDPEITPLVPVLKSYWLTIHVSLEAGSYGFLMLGAIIGLINLILMIFMTSENKTRLERMIKELSFISEMTLIGGLVMISVGTYLGGVWANESWGRYWGWDAKETWALVTILVYAFILHMRLIPKISGLFTYNLATIFGWASVIMTYYGVNYYLSGLHSYAAGDPIPIPSWVYIVIVSVVIISILAYWRKRAAKSTA